MHMPFFDGHILPESICTPATKKLISGPLIMKPGADLGRLSKEVDSIIFCEQMAVLGLHIVLSLLIATSCMAKMDQLFEKFKPVCIKSVLHLAAKKMQMWMEFKVAEMDKDNE